MADSIQNLDFYDQATLLERLGGGLNDEARQVIFVLGSALTSPPAPGEPGVPGVDGVIDLIEAQFGEDRRVQLRSGLASAANPYQEAFKFLLGGRGPRAANGIIKQAVSMARVATHNSGSGYALDAATSDDICRSFESDPASWHLTPAAEALGQLLVSCPDLFGKMVITTNFDPLIGVSVARLGGHSFPSCTATGT
jgi:hypothetical protein